MVVKKNLWGGAEHGGRKIFRPEAEHGGTAPLRSATACGGIRRGDLHPWLGREILYLTVSYL